MDRTANTRLQWVFETSNITNDKQTGFRAHKSTNEHVKFSHLLRMHWTKTYFNCSLFLLSISL